MTRPCAVRERETEGGRERAERKIEVVKDQTERGNAGTSRDV